eukprot:SAG22_NODE_4827_length_1156_cov_1.147588_1_plen_257_part_01
MQQFHLRCQPGLLLVVIILASSPATIAQVGQACTPAGQAVRALESTVAESLSHPSPAGLYGNDQNCTWLFQCASPASGCSNGTVTAGRFEGQVCSDAHGVVAAESGTDFANLWCELAPGCTLVSTDAAARVTVTFTALDTETGFDAVRLHDGSNTLAAELTPTRPNCWSDPYQGYHIVEGHQAAEPECYDTLLEAQAVCEGAADCFGIQYQAGVCDSGEPPEPSSPIYTQRLPGSWSVRRGAAATVVRPEGISIGNA